MPHAEQPDPTPQELADQILEGTTGRQEAFRAKHPDFVVDPAAAQAAYNADETEGQLIDTIID